MGRLWSLGLTVLCRVTARRECEARTFVTLQTCFGGAWLS